MVEFKVKSDLCPLVSLTQAFEDVQIEYLEMARVSGEQFVEVFEARGPVITDFRDAVMSASGITKVQVMEETPNTLVCQAVIGSRCIRTLLAQHGWIPLRVMASKGRESVAVAVNDLEGARDLVNFVKGNYSDFELSKIVSRGALGISSRHELRDFGLTSRQEEILKRALTAGYFDPYRKKTAKEIAQDMEIDRSTFSRHMRGALKKLLSELLE